jgi:tRNA(Ile)-lysidine synthase
VTPELVIAAPPGDGRKWAAAVSGGADSVAMLLLCREWVGHVVHLDHETRGEASTGDARVVGELARGLGLPVTVRRRSEMEPTTKPVANRSAHFRRLRLALYRDVVQEHGLAGVMQAHHADDQAETVALRLLRGSGFAGLVGIAVTSEVAGVRIHRPLLGVRKSELAAYLRAHGQTWREDASNASSAYGRNRVRVVLAERPGLTPLLLDLAGAARAYRDALNRHLPEVEGRLPIEVILSLPGPLREHLARRFLGRWVGEAEKGTIDRFLGWVGDAAGGAKLSLPGGRHARRRRGMVWVE